MKNSDKNRFIHLNGDSVEGGPLIGPLVSFLKSIQVIIPALMVGISAIWIQPSGMVLLSGFGAITLSYLVLRVAENFSYKRLFGKQPLQIDTNPHRRSSRTTPQHYFAAVNCMIAFTLVSGASIFLLATNTEKLSQYMSQTSEIPFYVPFYVPYVLSFILHNVRSVTRFYKVVRKEYDIVDNPPSKHRIPIKGFSFKLNLL